MTIQMFRVGNNGTDQLYPPPTPNTYVVVQWPNILEDGTGGFNTANGRWTAPGDGILLTGWQVWATQNVSQATNSSQTTKLVKRTSGGPYDPATAAIGGPGLYTNSTVMPGTMAVTVVSGDTFDLETYITPVSTGVMNKIDGNNAHTYWWGVFIPAGT